MTSTDEILADLESCNQQILTKSARNNAPFGRAIELIQWLTRTNQDKFNHIQAYCRAASQDKARIIEMDNLIDRSRTAMVVMRDILKAANINGEDICERIVADIDALHVMMIAELNGRIIMKLSELDERNLAYLAAVQKVIDKAKGWRADPPDGNVRDLVCDLRDAVDELIELEKK